MPSKTEEYLALAQRTANGLTRYWESWTDYLTTASRLYKYPFADQLMIYAQRPDATACADFDIWNNRMNRYVRRGAKGIALLDESSGFPRLHYVFDVSDTGVRRNSRDPEVWQLGPDLVQPVSEMLSKTYGISGERVSQQLADVAGKLVADYWDNNGGDIRAIVDGSLLMDYDEAGVEMQFKSAAAISVTYTLLERCGIEPAGWFDKDDFQAIYNFSTPDSVYALGAAVSDMSREVLRNIERTVKTTIRRRNAERSQYEYEQQERDLLDRRGLPAPEPNPEPAPEAAGQVRQAAPDVPDAVSPGTVQFDAPERDAVPASDGTGADSREPDAADHGAASEAGPSPGQSAEPTDVGAAHEQSESAGRGTGDDGADLQLSFLDANIPTEAQQIEKIDQAESEKTPSAFVLSQAEIENELRRHGSGFTGGKQRIIALYQTQPDRKLCAKALAKEYGIGGHSHDYLDGSRGFVNHDWKGLEFVHYPDHQKITLKWAQVEKYIDLMIQSDRYLTDEEKEQRATRQEASNYNVGDEVVVDLPTRTIEGTIGYVGETDVRIDTSAHGQSWDNEVINKQQFEQGLRQSATAQRVDKMLAQAEAIAKESEVPEYERFSVRKVVDGKMPLFAIWDDLYDDYYETNHAVPQFSNEKQAESYLENLKKEVADREAAEWLKVEHAKFLADKDEPEPSDEELDELPISAVMDGEVQTFPDAAALDEALNAAPAGNFRITDDHLGEGGAKQKYARNIEAIRTLFRLEEEHRGAPIEGAVLADQLAEAVQHIEGQYVEVEVETPDVADAEVERKTLPADPDVKNFSYAVVDGEVYYRENSIMTQVELSDNAKGRVAGMVELRQIVNELIDQQLDFPDEDIKASQAKLNAAYDAFTAKYGLINDKKNARLFDDDSSYYLLCSLENLDENKQLKSKADMFTKRTIRPERTVTSVDTPSEALAVSIGEHGRVDLPYMAELLGSPGDYERITTELQGVIFKDPSADADEPEAGWQTADEYLSGNVRNKLRMAQLAAESHPEFKINVEALTKAQPKDLEASEIDIRLGATWLNPAIVQQFMMETFQPPYRIRYNNLIQVRYSPFTSEWRIGNKSAAGMYDIMSTETYGTHRANAYKILEDTLNLRDCRIYDTIEEDGKERRVLNQKETMLAQQKQQAIKDTFAGWVWQDPQRRNLLVKQYNELFNSTRPREYDGSHIHFVGMNPEINLQEHQRNAVAHVLYGGNTLLAHEVGAGKSFEMAASAMESKRLGLCQKSLFVVPNHLTEQWASEFLRLYPNAKLLVTSKKDFEPANRKRFCARIATGDYDAVIIGHSQFEKIPLSAERQARIIEDQIEEIEKAIAEAKEQSGEHFTVKQMEKTRKTLEVKLKKLQSTDRKDDVVTFEQLGVDRLFVDESQNYKNLYLYTKMRNVAGLSTSEAQKSSDMFGKCRYLDEVTGGRGVIFATGTPISNSMTEMYTLMRYLQYSTLQQKQLTHFDAWASTFGETTTAIELAPEGTGYRARTRFAKFFNLPELMNMFKEAADIKTSDQLHLPVPEAKFETVVVKPSEIQQDMVKSLSERAAEVHSGAVDPSVDNMLKITSDGRKTGLDQRLMNPLTPDDPDSKLNACVDNVLRIWNETKEDNLTQLIFCDMSTPKGDGSFNVYDDIRTKLLAAGVPESEVEFIHNADTEGKKADLFSKVRSGKVRVLLGSTAKMGAGTNVQTLLVAVHHLDVGWRPSDMTQRNGRIIRQGNKNKQVYVYNYVTEGTFDAYLWQTLENKQKFISQIMTSKSPMRSCDDVDEQALSYAEVKALCAGDPRIREKMDLDVQVAKLKVLRSDYQNQKYRLEDKLLKHYPEEIQKAKNRIAALKNDAQIADAHPQDKENFCGMTIKGMVFDEKKAAGERLMLACKEMPNADMMLLGTYRGFELNIRFDSFKNEHQIVLRGELSYPVPLGDDPRGNIVRLDNAIGNFADRIADADAALDSLEQQKQAAEVEIAKPFAQEEELQTKSARLAELDALLNMEHQSSRTEPEAEEKPDARPSVLAALEEKADKVEPVRPFKSYLDKDGDAR